MKSHGATRRFTLTLRICFASALLTLTNCSGLQPHGAREAAHSAPDGGVSDGSLARDANASDVLSEGDCNLLSNQGCPEGRHCALYLPPGSSEGRYVAGCLPDRPDEQNPGEPCAVYRSRTYDLSDNCAPGSWCIGNTPREPTCMQLCTSAEPGLCDGAYQDREGNAIDGLCLVALRLDTVEPGLAGCLEPKVCNAACQDCPGSSEVCLPLTDRGGHRAVTCMPMVRGEAGGVYGDNCGAINSCQPGFVCVGGHCRAICELAAAPTLDGGPSGGGDECDFSSCRHASLPDGSVCVEHTAAWTTQGYGICAAP